MMLQIVLKFKRGYLRPGYYADLAIINRNKKTEVKKENILYKCGWSPFEGTNFSNAVQSTFINGQRVYHLGNFNEISSKNEIKI